MGYRKLGWNYTNCTSKIIWWNRRALHRTSRWLHSYP